jgi:hypothetical protein
MNSTFLHENKTIPPDETGDQDAPKCENCGAETWLIRVDKKLSDGKTEASYTYQCQQCGALANRNEVGVEPAATVNAVE